VAFSVELSPTAERGRTQAPVRARRLINQCLREIAADPRWTAGSWRFLNPGRSPENSGLIAQVVQAGRRLFVIVYRIRSTERVVWVEDIRELMVG
jgi:hypothetical protein